MAGPYHLCILLALASLFSVSFGATRFNSCKASDYKSEDNPDGLCEPNVEYTAGGHPMNETIRENMADLSKTTLIARFPIADGFMRFLNISHIVGVGIIIIILISQFPLTKGTKAHMTRGRVLSYGVFAWFFPCAWLLNAKMILWVDVDNFNHGSAILDWRGQFSYIVPWGITTCTSTILGFYLQRHATQHTNTICKISKYGTIFGLIFSSTISAYMIVSVAFGISHGAFGRDVVGQGKSEGWFQQLNILLGLLLPFNCALDVLHLHMLNAVLDRKITWKDQHKMSMMVFYIQASIIVMAFVGFYPLFLLGFGADALPTPFHSIPLIIPIVFGLPMYYGRWIFAFLKRLFLKQLDGKTDTKTTKDKFDAVSMEME